MKKILFTIFIFLILIKITDVLLVKFVGLGNPLIYQHSKIFGYDLLPNQMVERRGKKITINDFGMRSNFNWSDKFDKRILFFGDSVTFGGSLVSDEETFVSITCKKIKKIKTICGNYAFNGYGIESITNKLIFRNFDNEDLVIIVFIGNDFERGINSLAIQPYFSKKIDNFLPALTELVFIVLDKVRNKIRFNYAQISEKKEIYEKYQTQEILKFKRAIDNLNKEYLIFYSPEFSEFNNSVKYDYIKQKLEKNNIKFYDLTKVLEKDKNKIYYDNVHLNKFGHQIFSNIILEKIYNKTRILN